MNIEDFREYCLGKKGVTESFPFDQTTLVFKVMNRIFALTDTGSDFSINLKCDPRKSVDLRERYASVRPGYHMNKKHWITVEMDPSISTRELKEWIDHSYDLVVEKLTKKEKESLAAL